MNQQDASTATVMAAIDRHNAGRDPERLAMKYAKMAQSPFAFLRGSCQHFYDTLPDAEMFVKAPLAWCCGDLHFENYGSYKGDDRQVYFDINDYDEAALAPLTWDIVRLLTSLQCGADVLRASPAEALAVSASCLQAYRQALRQGKALWVHRDTAKGLVQVLLDDLKARDRATHLDKRTIRQGKLRRLKVDGVKALPASEAQRQAVTNFMRGFAATQENPHFFDVIDVARRVAGTGSLGLARYVVLVEGKGSPDGNYLLDLKAAQASALSARLLGLDIPQPLWEDQAQRVVAVQKRMQAVDHAFLHAVQLEGRPFVLKGLQPSEDRVAIGDWGKKLDHLKEVADTMGRILAWDQLRAAGRAAAAGAEELMAYAQGEAWTLPLLEAATTMAATVRQQWAIFAQAQRRGSP